MQIDNGSENRRTRFVNVGQDNTDELVLVGKALGSPMRIQILEFLQDKSANVSEIAQGLGIPRATADLHVSVLADAGFLEFETLPAKRGVQKVCTRSHDIVVLHVPKAPSTELLDSVTTDMPIGNFVDYDFRAVESGGTCGMVGENSPIGMFDDIASFHEPDRVNAQVIWFSAGHLEYRFPFRSQGDRIPRSLTLTAELCSEAEGYHLDWPSDIFVEVNDVELGLWTSPADFGGTRGRLTPDWWSRHNTQFGLVPTWTTDTEGTTINGEKISNVGIDELNLGQHSFVKVRLGVRPDAKNCGGMNLFGERFGNAAQGIVLKLEF